MAGLGINLLAVLVAAVATFALGALWYSPLLFAKAWMTAHGFTAEQLQAMQKDAPRAYTVTFLCWLVMAAAVAILAHRIGIQTALGGLKLGALCWVGFAATVGLSGHVFSDRRIGVFIIDTGYQFVSLLAMGVIIAVWR